MTTAHRVSEARECEWFVLCNRLTDIRVEHSIFGPIPCCERCCDVISVPLPPNPPAGWRVRITSEDPKHDETHAFMSRDPHACRDNVATNFRRWHPSSTLVEIKVLEPIAVGTSGWAEGNWTGAFKT